MYTLLTISSLSFRVHPSENLSTSSSNFWSEELPNPPPSWCRKKILELNADNNEARRALLHCRYTEIRATMKRGALRPCYRKQALSRIMPENLVAVLKQPSCAARPRALFKNGPRFSVIIPYIKRFLKLDLRVTFLSLVLPSMPKKCRLLPLASSPK